MDKGLLAEKMFEFITQYGLMSTFIKDYLREQEDIDTTVEEIIKLIGYDD